MVCYNAKLVVLLLKRKRIMPKQKIEKSTQNSSEINLELYTELLEDLKSRVATSRYKAVRMVNNELIFLYHHIGSEIIRRQESHGWGSKIIDKLSKDLSASFPEMKGFGTSNLNYMRRFAKDFMDYQFVQQVAGQLPWFHLVTIMDKVKNVDARVFYIMEAIGCGWSRSVLTLQIESDLYNR